LSEGAFTSVAKNLIRYTHLREEDFAERLG